MIQPYRSSGGMPKGSRTWGEERGSGETCCALALQTISRIFPNPVLPFMASGWHLNFDKMLRTQLLMFQIPT